MFTLGGNLALQKKYVAVMIEIKEALDLRYVWRIKKR